MLDRKIRAQQILAELELQKAGIKKPITPKSIPPAFDYRQTINLYNSSPSNQAIQNKSVITQSQPEQQRGYFDPIPEQVRARDIVRELPNALYQVSPLPSVTKGFGLVTGAVSGLMSFLAGKTIEEYKQTKDVVTGKKNITDYDVNKVYNTAIDYAKEGFTKGQKSGEVLTPYIGGFAVAGALSPVIATAGATALGTYILSKGVMAIADEYGRISEEAKLNGEKNPGLKATLSAMQRGGSTGWQLWGFNEEDSNEIAKTNQDSVVKEIFKSEGLDYIYLTKID